MLVINIIVLCLCGFIISTWILQLILSIKHYYTKKEEQAIEELTTIIKELIKEQDPNVLKIVEKLKFNLKKLETERYSLYITLEERYLQLKAEREAHLFWKNKWAELNNNITKGDNE